jgi:two-component system response regulator HydG
MGSVGTTCEGSRASRFQSKQAQWDNVSPAADHAIFRAASCARRQSSAALNAWACVIAATNRDLPHEVDEGRFREDLFHRINVVAVDVPPLRARGGDVLMLAKVFADRAASRKSKQLAGFTRPAAQLLVDYDWPGNVRELENCIERAVALCRGDELEVADLPAKVVEHRSTRLVLNTESPAQLLTLAEVQQRYVMQVVAATGGNKTQAARILGIDRRSIYRRLEESRRSPSPGRSA